MLFSEDCAVFITVTLLSRVVINSHSQWWFPEAVLIGDLGVDQ